MLVDKQYNAIYVVNVMNEILLAYREAFNRLSNEKLHQHGSTFKFIPDYPGLSEWVLMKFSTYFS